MSTLIGQLERQKVSLNSRQFIWQGGKRLSVSQVAQRLHKGNVHMPVEYIEDAILSWLEEAYEPEGITDGDMEEAAQMAVEEWIQAHYEQRD